MLLYHILPFLALFVRCCPRYLEWGVLSYFTVLIPAMALLGLHNEISEELGEPLIHFLSSEEKKHILIVIIIASLLVIGM